MTIEQVAADYIAAGWQVVPLVKGEKRASGSWQKRKYAPKDFNPSDGIALKCGEPSGWRIDVDCDAPEAVVAAKLLLPNTGLIHGRPGKPSSHYWYLCEGAKTTQFTDIKNASGSTQMLVEIRSTGGYTAGPPSGHPSGDVIAWESQRDPLRVTPDALYAMVRAVALAALLGRHWPGSGARHSIAGPLAGFLLQGGLDAMTVVQVCKVAMKIAGDTDTSDRLKSVRSTCDKFEAGERVTGGPKLAECLSPELVGRMRGWLKLADLDAIEEMNAKHFFVRLGSKAVIGREDSPSGVIFQSPRELYPEYANRFVQTGVDEDGKATLKPLFDEWFKSSNRRSFKEVVFLPPPLETDATDYNLWRGFDLEEREGDCTLILDHMLHNLCRGDATHFEYLVKFCAWTVQNPATPPGVAVILRGEQGTGKGAFMHLFKRIFGPHYVHLSRSDELVRWNSLTSGKVVVFADEAFFAGDKQHVGVLKRIITEPTLTINRKYLETVEERNCMHLFMATNEDWAIPAGIGERRFFALHVSDACMQDPKYFGPLWDCIKGEGASAFLWFLRHR
jgi:hypothetical protein